MKHIDPLFMAVLLILAVHFAHGAEIALTWDPPVGNEDGSELVDLAGYRLEYAPLVVYYSEAGGLITNKVLGTGSWVRVWVDAPPVSLTLVAQGYIFRVCAVSGMGMPSEWSDPLEKRVGKPQTVKLRLMP